MGHKILKCEKHIPKWEIRDNNGVRAIFGDIIDNFSKLRKHINSQTEDAI